MDNPNTADRNVTPTCRYGHGDLSKVERTPESHFWGLIGANTRHFRTGTPVGQPLSRLNCRVEFIRYNFSVVPYAAIWSSSMTTLSMADRHLHLVYDADTNNSAPPPQTFDTGGGGGNNGDMRDRLTALETRFDSVLPTLATKADIEDLRTGIHKVDAT